MGGILGDLFLLALGIAISPLPIVAVILLLTGSQGRSRGTAYLMGWLLGLLSLVCIVIFLVRGHDYSRHSTPSLILSSGMAVSGVVLMTMAYLSWRRRPQSGATPQPPRWVELIRQVTPPKALGAGFLLGGFNIKNLFIIAAAAAIIGQTQLDFGREAIAVLIFITLATLGIAVPVYVAIAQGEKGEVILTDWEHWLIANNATILAILFLLMGVKLLGKGLDGLL